MPAFVDTNILLYAASTAPHEADKSRIARQILVEGNWRLSTQVLQEFYVNAIRKLTKPLSEAAALAFMQQVTRVQPVAIDLGIVLRGIHNARRYRISYWDGAIVAAAQMSGCEILYSEDLNHGQSYDQVRAVNPFQSGLR
ncbi:PIN domain-containing protein [Algiphilus sp. W345]|uniref:PIN domain-containing protein n=1 Tax=Banduia mediterranea TaxID=3075609 RepID=A0ABU2WJH7_9GAMM|nr:PIN domain-containing protein [Algiphilus sp. W345]MDT0497394.1 PIN domain-containing protein [Algiphilus sp. W345]